MKLKDGINIYEYDAHTGFGIIFKAKSIIIKSNENVVVISPADFSHEVIEELKRYQSNLTFISPNNFHNINLAKMKSLFPAAKFYGPKRSAKQSKIDLLKLSDLNLNESLIPLAIQGNRKLSETCFYHAPSKTLIVTDLLFNMRHKMNFSTKLALKMAGAYHQLAMSRFLKSMIDNKEAFYKSIKGLESYPFETVILNHGDSIDRKSFTSFFN